MGDTLQDKTIDVKSSDVWEGFVFIRCKIVAQPDQKAPSFLLSEFVDCTFLYDGMEVSGEEWFALVTGSPPIRFDLKGFDLNG